MKNNIFLDLITCYEDDDVDNNDAQNSYNDGDDDDEFCKIARSKISLGAPR